MPLVRVSLLEGRTSEEKATIAQNIYEAMRETIGIPENDKFVLFDERGPDAFLIDRSYLGIERTEAVLLIEITFRSGRTVEMKQALYAHLADRLHAHAGLRKEDVFVVLHENGPADWSFGNGIAQYV